jgi:hypothetical protein
MLYHVSLLYHSVPVPAKYVDLFILSYEYYNITITITI